MQYTQQVQDLIADPFSGREPESIRLLCHSELAQVALAHVVDSSMVPNVAKNLGVTVERAEELIEETKRFLVVGRLVGAQLAPSPEIDEVWHTWILFTKDYHTFCDKLGGYIHHKPIPAGSPSQPPLEPTIALMVAAFDQIDAAAWPVDAGARGIMDCKMGA